MELSLAKCMDCRQSADQDYTLEEVMLRVVGDLGIPVAFGLRSGHVSRANITLAESGVGSTWAREFWSPLEMIDNSESTEDHEDLPRDSRNTDDANPKHIHLIGICGTAMASLAGMLQRARVSRYGI